MLGVRYGDLCTDIGTWDLCDDNTYQKKWLSIVVVVVVVSTCLSYLSRKRLSAS